MTTQPRHHWFRIAFGLRTLFIFVPAASPRALRCWLCVALALAILAIRVSPAAAQMSVEILTASALGENAKGPHFQDVEDAIQEFKSRDYEAARKHLEDARQKTPKLAPTEIMMAQLFFASNQAARGRLELEKAVKNSPQDPEAYLLLGEIKLQEGRVTEAGLLFSQANEVTAAFKDNPKRLQNFKIRSFAGLASVDESLKRWKEAKANLLAWVEADPESANPHQRLGRALFHLKESEKAYAEFQTAFKAGDKLPPVDVTMASLYWADGDKTQAETFLNRAVDNAGKDLRTQLALAQLLLTMNRIAEARKYADEAVKLDPKSIDAKLMAGVLAREQGDFKKAKKLLDEIHSQTPSNLLAINQHALGLLEGDEASKQRALEFAEMAEEPFTTLTVLNDCGRRLVVRTRAVGTDTWSDPVEVPAMNRQSSVLPRVRVPLTDAEAYDVRFYLFSAGDRVTEFEVASLRVHELASNLAARAIWADRLGTFSNQQGSWTFTKDTKLNALRLGASSSNRTLDIIVKQP